MEIKQARYLHQMLDRLAEGKTLNPQDVEALRKNLPELPKQKTLTEITQDVYRAWYETLSNHWKERKFGNLETWLEGLHEHLQELEDTPTASPSLPAGMRIAEHENFGRVVVSPGVNVAGRYEVFYLAPSAASGTDLDEVAPGSLTFIDSEPAKPAHPEFLETEADYANAPEGTIVACEDSLPWHKFHDKWSSVDFIDFVEMKDDRGMSRACRQILRWGWGE